MLSLSGFPLSIRFLSSASLPVPATQPLLLPFLFLPALASQWLLRCSASAFASSVFPVLSSLISRAFFPGSSYSAFCLFPFALPRFASHSCSTSASLLLSLSGFSAFRPVSFVPFRSASGYSAFCSSFPLLPVSASQWLPQCSVSALASSVFPVLSCLVSHAFFPGSSYSVFCSFPFILPGFAPTAVPPVLPFFSASFRPLLFRAFRLLSAFFRPLLLASDYSASRSFFSLLPVFPCRRFLRCSPVPFVPFVFLFRPACFHAFLPIPVLSFLRFLSTFPVSPHSGYFQSSSFGFLFRIIPLGFRFRFCLMGRVIHPEN